MNTVEYTADASGKWVKTVYSKSFLSDKIDLGDGLLVTITGYDEARVNPFASAIGALGPETETPPASFVAHFKNTSTEPVTLELSTLKVYSHEHALGPKTLTIQPGEIADSDKTMGNYSTWSHNIETELSVNVKSQKITKTIVLKQETQQQLNERMKRYEESKRSAK